MRALAARSERELRMLADEELPTAVEALPTAVASAAVEALPTAAENPTLDASNAPANAESTPALSGSMQEAAKDDSKSVTSESAVPAAAPTASHTPAKPANIYGLIEPAAYTSSTGATATTEKMASLSAAVKKIEKDGRDGVISGQGNEQQELPGTGASPNPNPNLTLTLTLTGGNEQQEQGKEKEASRLTAKKREEDRERQRHADMVGEKQAEKSGNLELYMAITEQGRSDRDALKIKQLEELLAKERDKHKAVLHELDALRADARQREQMLLAEAAHMLRAKEHVAHLAHELTEARQKLEDALREKGELRMKIRRSVSQSGLSSRTPSPRRQGSPRQVPPRSTQKEQPPQDPEMCSLCDLSAQAALAGKTVCKHFFCTTKLKWMYRIVITGHNSGKQGDNYQHLWKSK